MLSIRKLGKVSYINSQVQRRQTYCAHYVGKEKGANLMQSMCRHNISCVQGKKRQKSSYFNKQVPKKIPNSKNKHSYHTLVTPSLIERFASCMVHQNECLQQGDLITSFSTQLPHATPPQCHRLGIYPHLRSCGTLHSHFVDQLAFNPSDPQCLKNKRTLKGGKNINFTTHYIMLTRLKRSLM